MNALTHHCHAIGCTENVAGTDNEVDRQTLKHHADDLIGVGGKALKLLEG